MKSPVFKFTERDGELLVDLYKHRYLSVSQLQRLHFPSIQTTYRRMRLLKGAGLVQTFNVANIDESIFTLASRGMDKLAETIGVERKDLKWNDAQSKPKDYYFMRHFLAINDFRITLRQACWASGVRLLGFIPDYYGERSDSGNVQKYIKDIVIDKSATKDSVSHTPDGVFALEAKGKAALFFLEVDRGTEVISDPKAGVLKALKFYAAYLLDGKYQRFAKDFETEAFKGFRVLMVTTTRERVLNIRAACKTLDVPAKAKQFLWLSGEELHEKSIFGPVWVSADADDRTTYRIF